MWSTTAAEKERLARAVRSHQRPRVLEVGAFRGETTKVLAEAAGERGGRVVVIDPMRWAAELVHNGIARHLPRPLGAMAGKLGHLLGASSYEPAFWDNVGPARDVVDLRRARSDDPALVADPDPRLASFDVVFVDGDHGEDGARHDLRVWGRRAAPGGTIFVHDAVPAFPGVVAALGAFAREHGLDVTWPTEGSLAAIRVERALGSTALSEAAE